MTQKTRAGLGLIGFGAWGSHHAQAIAKTPDAELLAIAVRTETSRKRAQAAFPQAMVTNDYRELLELDQIDLVDIVVPNSLHRNIGVAAFRAGKHVLLEKPMATTMEDCRDLLRAASEADRQLIIDFELRLSSQWGNINSLIQRGQIGEPRYLLIELFRQPYRLGADGWRYDIDRVGNWVLEEPIHFLDLARWYLSAAGEPCEIYATANARDPMHPELQDNFSAVLTWPNGAYALISQTLNAFEHHQTLKASGTDGSIWAGWSGAMDRTDKPTFFTRLQRGRESAPREIQTSVPSGELFELQSQIASAVRTAATGRKPTASGWDGLWATGLCLAAQQSVAERRPVDIQAFMAPWLNPRHQ